MDRKNIGIPMVQSFKRPFYLGNWPKPGGGFWTSSGPAYYQHCYDKGYDNWEAPCYTIFPQPHCQLLEIDTKKDLKGVPGHELVKLDFIFLADLGLSGVHCTQQGAQLLPGWDCESTFWMRWAFYPQFGFDHGGMAELGRRA